MSFASTSRVSLYVSSDVYGDCADNIYYDVDIVMYVYIRTNSLDIHMWGPTCTVFWILSKIASILVYFVIIYKVYNYVKYSPSMGRNT